jgi:hypothetical protein
MREQKNTSADAGKAEAAALRSAVVRTAIEVAAMAAKITYGCPKALMDSVTSLQLVFFFFEVR